MKNLSHLLPRLFLYFAAYSVFSLAFPFSICAQVPDSVKHYLDTVITITKRESYYSDKIDWPSLQKEMYAKAVNARSVPDLRDAFQLMLERLGDTHGGIYFAGGKGAEYRIPSSRPAHPQQDTVQALLRKWAFKTNAQTIDGEWGYVLIPSIGGIGSEQITERATAIQKAVENVTERKVKGWIIDLRYNTGGNLYAVATGMAAFLPEGAHEQYVKADRSPAFQVIMKNGNLQSDDGFRPTELQVVQHQMGEEVPVIVLVSRHTASAGEGLAYLLRQRKNTILLGEETGGFCSGTNFQDLDQKLGLNLTTAYPIDKNGNTFDSLKPDVQFQGKYGLGNVDEDDYVKEALAVLKGKKRKI